MKLPNAIMILFIGLGVACRAENTPVSTPDNPIESISPTPIRRTPIPLPTTTKIPAYSFFDTLPDGEYMVEEEYARVGCVYNYYSLNGKLISHQQLEKCGTLSRDGTHLASVEEATTTWHLSIYDLTSNQVYNIPEANDCFIPSWSPDGTRLAMYCNSDIYILSLADKSLSELTTWTRASDEGTWNSPAWSPDGKWIAYTNVVDFQPSEHDGVYITDTSCLAEPLTCEDKTIGPIIPFGNSNFITWSPDSQSIAFDHLQNTEPYNYEIYRYNLEIQAKQKLIELPSYIEGLSWSPGGRWIAMSREGFVYLLTTDGKETKRVETAARRISFWIQVPFSDMNAP